MDGLQYLSSEILSKDTSSCSQLFDRFLKLYHIAKAKISQVRHYYHHESVIIRASVQWYVWHYGISNIKSQNKGKCDQPMSDIFGF